ncbi:MAG: winged helix-turn-helix domain-containing protein [Bryobacteraceae bacterium]
MLSIVEARRIALAAQGFGRARPARVTERHLEETVRRIAPLQLDFVNVLVPAHFLIPFSRLGAYRRETLHTLIYSQTKFTEQWAHEAAVIPVETWPFLKHRMAGHRVRPHGFDKLLESHKEYADRVLQAIREYGPLAAADLPAPPEETASFSGTWIGTFQRAVLEAQFGRGVLASANRLPNFARAYDLAERRIPGEHHGHEPTREEAHRELILRAARAHGVGTAHDLADYYRLNITEARVALAGLAADGELEPVSVEGWAETAYLHPMAARPKAVRANALLSPFDPVVWFRPRTRRLFGFDYTIEIYTPAAKRKYGYYVLPFLQDERLTARVDLKAERAAKTLRVMAAYCEDGADPDAVKSPLLAELETLAGWLGLSSIAIERKGNLALQD